MLYFIYDSCHWLVCDTTVPCFASTFTSAFRRNPTKKASLDSYISQINSRP